MARAGSITLLLLLVATACGADVGDAADARLADGPRPPADARRPADARPAADAFPGPDGGVCEIGLLCDGACVDPLTDDRHCGDCDLPCDAPRHCVDGMCTRSNIEHVVLIVQENHTFDSYFGAWCRAPAYSDPICTAGAACCEAGPSKDPGTGAAVRLLDDAANLGSGVLGQDPNHGRLCQLAQIHGGKMDRFVAGAAVEHDPICESECSRPENFAYSDRATVGGYWQMAEDGAIADRYFQPTVGATSANTLYFLTAHWIFDDADYRPRAIGSSRADGSDARCVDPTGQCLSGAIATFRGGDTIADRLAAAGLQMTGFIEGYAGAVQATAPLGAGGTITGCAHASDDCPFDGARRYACVYEPADVPFAYFDTLTDDPSTSPGTPGLFIEDYEQFRFAVRAGTLPDVAYLHAYTFRNEHPKFATITEGVEWVAEAASVIATSPLYADNTLVLVVWDEGGGFFDHVDPIAAFPVPPDTDPAGRPIIHGTRVPLIALGRFAAKGTVSHVVMDHSSIVSFLEYNFLPPELWLHQADDWVHNIGSLLDERETGIRIPE